MALNVNFLYSAMMTNILIPPTKFIAINGPVLNVNKFSVISLFLYSSV